MVLKFQNSPVVKCVDPWAWLSTRRSNYIYIVLSHMIKVTIQSSHSSQANVTHDISHGSTRVNDGVKQGAEFFIWVWLKVVKVWPSGWKLGRLATTKRAGTRRTRAVRTPTSCGALCVSLIVKVHYLKNSYLEGYLQRLIWVFGHVFQGHLAQDSFSEKISNIDAFDEIFLMR